ncbi:hypothetical protein [Frateuria sp. Soil773]|uniref:hypothetical protein n=1 Tax=Frateuria sp. Soil773 TaxID=1736407 RepID=UPI0012F83962|nr:hypothetical protein [Frateuria sp. Soil773]
MNLPLGLLYLRQALHEGHIGLRLFCWAGPLVVLAMLACIPLLLGLGRRLRLA